MDFFDSHAHLSSAELLPSVDGIMDRARIAKVGHIVNICTDRASLEAGLKLSVKYPQIINAGSTTPHDVGKDGEADFHLYEEAAEMGLLKAVGETGLDYHYEHSERATQKLFLIRYLKLAARLRLPVIFHCREAFADLFSIVDGEYPKGAPAILHCFTGDQREAEGVLARGWYLSLSGIVTYKKSEILRDIARNVPLDQLLIETDAPYLAPQSKRGRVNESAYISETAESIAKCKGITVLEVANATKQNGIKVFGL